MRILTNSGGIRANTEEAFLGHFPIRDSFGGETGNRNVFRATATPELGYGMARPIPGGRGGTFLVLKGTRSQWPGCLRERTSVEWGLAGSSEH